jgi:hypothetical protein
VLISSHRKLLQPKAVVVNVAETSGQDPGRHGRERRIGPVEAGARLMQAVPWALVFDGAGCGRSL